MSFSDIRKAIMDNDITRVQALVAQHPEIVNVKNSSNEGPLYMASYFGYLPIVEYLVNNGAVIDQQETRTGWTSLNIAVNRGHTSVVGFLINAGADWNIATYYGDTPLIIACYKNKNNSHLEIIEMFLILGVDITVENVAGMNALAYAEDNDDKPVIKLLTDIMDADAIPFTLDNIQVSRKKIPNAAEDFVNMENVNIEDFLKEDPENKVIKVANNFYATNGNDIKTHYLKQSAKKDYIYYPCKEVMPHALFIVKNNVHMDKPLFSASYLVGVLSDFVLLKEVIAMIKSKSQYFEIFPSEFEAIPATASAQMLIATRVAVGANHCQEGKAAKILKLKKINIVKGAKEAVMVKFISKSLSLPKFLPKSITPEHVPSAADGGPKTRAKRSKRSKKRTARKTV
jgi:ankyrin repeat protein